MGRRCAGRVGRLLGGSLAGCSGSGSGHLVSDDREADRCRREPRLGRARRRRRARGRRLDAGAIGPTTPARRCARAGQPLVANHSAAAASSPAVACRRAIARSTRPSDPAPVARVRPPPRHRFESLEERRDSGDITELGGDVGRSDVDEDGHVVERPLGHLAAAIRDPDNRLVATTEVEEQDRVCRAEARARSRSLTGCSQPAGQPR